MATLWPPLIVELKIESVSRIGCLSGAPSASYPKGMQQTKAQRRLVLGFSIRACSTCRQTHAEVYKAL